MGLLQTIQGRLLQYDSPSRQLQQAHFDAARRLAQAQFQLADAELSKRLWQDVADRDLDVDRILNLLYGCCSRMMLRRCVLQTLSFSRVASRN